MVHTVTASVALSSIFLKLPDVRFTSSYIWHVVKLGGPVPVHRMSRCSSMQQRWQATMLAVLHTT
jgi:hypothetical protein